MRYLELMKKISIGIFMIVLTTNLFSENSNKYSSVRDNQKEAYSLGNMYFNNSMNTFTLDNKYLIDPEKIYNRGVKYLYGQNVKKDTKKARELFLKSANLGYARAQYNLGVIYLQGIGVRQSNYKASKWFKMAEKQNLPEAIYVVGLLHKEGKGVVKDRKIALEYYLRAAKLEEKRALSEIKKVPMLLKALVHEKKGKEFAQNTEYKSSIIEYQKAMATYKELLDSEGLYIASIWDAISKINFNMRDFLKALLNQKKVLNIRQKVLGNNDRSVAFSYLNIGLTLHEMHDYHNAIKNQKKALDIAENFLGKLNISTGAMYHRVAISYQEMDDPYNALTYFKKSIEIKTKNKKSNRVDLAGDFVSLAILYDHTGDSRLAQSFARKALGLIEKNHDNIDDLTRARFYTAAGSMYLDNNDSRALEYYQKALHIIKFNPGDSNIELSGTYFALASLYEKMKNYSKAMDYTQKALSIDMQAFGEKNIYTITAYHLMGSLSHTMGDNAKSLFYYQKALTNSKDIKRNDSTLYGALGSLYLDMQDYQNAYIYAQKAFDLYLLDRNNYFSILDSKQKEKYLKKHIRYIDLFLKTSYHYIQQLNKEGNTTKAQQILHRGANAWLNYKGSIFDSENAIATLYASTKDKKLKQKIEQLVSFKRYLAKLYQSLPKPKEKELWKKHIKDTEIKISKLSGEFASKIESLKEQQGLKNISYKDITSHLKKDELYIDYAKTEEYYYLFTLNHKGNITFVQIDKNSTKKVDFHIKTFREDINTILKSQKLSEDQLKKITQQSKETLSSLYTLIFQKPLGGTIKNKTSLIISPDAALRLLPFETLYDKANGKYLIEEKEIRYIPSGKELVRLYKYGKHQTKQKEKIIIFANPDFNAKKKQTSKNPQEEELPLTPNTNRAGIIKSLFRMHFAPLPGTKVEAEEIKQILKKNKPKEYARAQATEAKLLALKEPSILHIATHGFFINDKNIPNPMLKSGIALAGANVSLIRGRSDGVVTALKLSGLDLKGTDLVVLSACETGVVDINSTDSVSGLFKAFIQAGAKDVVMSLWSVDDQATKELMGSFYRQMKQNKNRDYAQALKEAKLKMIREGKHPFYWGAFVVSGE